jgi:molecular chaperone HscA
MAIHVLQGERERVEDCRSLARFELRGIPPMAAGAARIRVTFQVDADGLLSVTAQEQISGVESSVQVKPSYGLTDREIEQMLRDSMAHARDDVAARTLREVRVEAGRLLEAVDSALAADAALLSAAERASLDQALTALRVAVATDDARRIKSAVEALNAASSEFAARRMNSSIRAAMAGHKVEEFG